MSDLTDTPFGAGHDGGAVERHGEIPASLERYLLVCDGNIATRMRVRLGVASTTAETRAELVPGIEAHGSGRVPLPNAVIVEQRATVLDRQHDGHRGRRHGHPVMRRLSFSPVR